jgi:hypothetical protein
VGKALSTEKTTVRDSEYDIQYHCCQGECNKVWQKVGRFGSQIDLGVRVDAELTQFLLIWSATLCHHRCAGINDCEGHSTGPADGRSSSHPFASIWITSG